MITVELTTQQAELLLQCLDLATKAGGLQTARTTVMLAEIIVAASQVNNEPG